MAQFFTSAPNPPIYPNVPNNSQNLQFYTSSYPQGQINASPGTTFGGYGQSASPAFGYGGNFSAPSGVSGRMGEQGGLRTGWLAAFGTEGYEGEPTLLEELGVNFSHIRSKTLAVLNPLTHIDQHLMDDSDLAGPILFFFLFGTFLLFSGKVHFGFIYGLALLGSVSLHIILSLMSPPPADSIHATRSQPPSPQSSLQLTSSLTFPRSLSVLGYCLLPLVFVSLVGVILPLQGMGGYILTTAAIIWCTYSSSGMFCAVGRMHDMRGLVAYPLALFYVGFGVMGVFSRGSAKVVNGKGNL
ncbi:Protein transport protein yip1 [Golovinomyces cichoracearum]|uniref:Protein YIP n=1 Tax=Golovinomyces cichoracearum TaxID=62708 RepID=A0A420IFT3_9PEZI|nr:Protein transport protein yip1 [Golovinomyces cichoracearum]